jgi:hypothetical protein
MLLSCATLRGPVEEVPPEAPAARVMRFLSPGQRDMLLPPSRLYSARPWLEALVCPIGEVPGWRRIDRSGFSEQYEIDCPGLSPIVVELDSSSPSVRPPPPLRALGEAGLASFQAAVEALQKQEGDKAVEALDAAIAADPAEVVYRRERIYALYVAGRLPDALAAADAMLTNGSDPVAAKYRVLIARELGLPELVTASLELLLSSCPKQHPLYAEGVCAKGMFLAAERPELGRGLMEQGCRLGHTPCCEAVEARFKGEAKASP